MGFPGIPLIVASPASVTCPDDKPQHKMAEQPMCRVGVRAVRNQGTVLTRVFPGGGWARLTLAFLKGGCRPVTLAL